MSFKETAPLSPQACAPITAPMSKSLKRVRALLEAADITAQVLEMPGETRTAADAAREAGCALDQIAKSIIFRGETTDTCFLFITAGGHQVDPAKATRLAGEPLGRSDAAFVRAKTGYAIGGVAPIGHKEPGPAFFDPRLLIFDQVFAAAGTPRHIFCISPRTLLTLSGAKEAAFVSI